jgi:dTDP-glucose 4,6-dehydratase
MSKKTILVTGGAGFIGSNYIHNHRKNRPDDTIINLDCLSYAADLRNLEEIQEDSLYRFIEGNVLDQELVEDILTRYEVSQIIHFAAESHVDRSIADPSVFIRNNVEGTLSMLEAAKRAWHVGVDEEGYPRYKEGVRYLQVSTDEVYGALGADGVFSEESSLRPSSPYAASKASGDLLVHSYGKTFHLPINITRCSNNYGPRQHREKLIPCLITKALRGESLPIYGRGMHVRDWIHVEDHCRALDLVLQAGRLGEVYNVAGENERTNISIAKEILSKLGLPEERIKYVPDRLGHDFRYALTNEKIWKDLSFAPSITMEERLQDIIAWYSVQEKQEL